MKKALFLFIIFSVWSCNTLQNESVTHIDALNFAEASPNINDYGKTVLERFDTPFNYMRSPIEPHTFASYLRSLKLKPNGTPARYYDGKPKPNNNVYVSVVDLPISHKNVQITSNSVMRLISEFLYQNQEYRKISFHTNKEKISYTEFCKGDFSRDKFHEFMDYIMERVSTPSFCTDLKPVQLDEIKIGDIFVQNNLNGHAVIVVDMAKNREGEKLFLLAQGFQPAQEIQILANPEDESISPWYKLNEGDFLTPEWRFKTSDLMRFDFLNK